MCAEPTNLDTVEDIARWTLNCSLCSNANLVKCECKQLTQALQIGNLVLKNMGKKMEEVDEETREHVFLNGYNEGKRDASMVLRGELENLHSTFETRMAIGPTKWLLTRSK